MQNMNHSATAAASPANGHPGTAIHIVGDFRIRTSHEFPPILDRRFDWSAIDDDTYDGADDSSCPIGRGATEQEAIDDLLDQLTDGEYSAANGQFGVGA